MLELASLGKPPPHAFAFGGVAFEIVAPAALGFQLSEELEQLVARDASLPVAAAVRCNVEVDPRLPDGELRGLHIRRTGHTTQVASETLRAEISRSSLSSSLSARYEARARIAPPRDGEDRPFRRGPDAVVAGLAAAIVEAQRGLQLHAAAIELGSCAVLFLGPSGAGKSTAVRLVEGARVFAFDRVSVSRDLAGAYTVWSLPGGAPVEAPPSARRALPLAALLRVRREREEPAVVETRGARALFAIRESTEVGDRSAAGEELRMNTVTDLLARTVVGEIHTVLASPHRAMLHEFLSARSPVYARAAHGLQERSDVER